MRTAHITRNTNETKIDIKLNLDGTGQHHFKTNIPFLEHMLEQITRHGMLDLDIVASGDIEVDYHHTVEDIGIALGQAFNTAISDKKGITRYGYSYVPLDEALSRVVIDISGRPSLNYFVKYTRNTVGNFDLELVSEFFQGFVNHAMVTLHIDNLRGQNAHHQVETIFKAFGRALRDAISYDEKMKNKTPSTKGTLSL